MTIRWQIYRIPGLHFPSKWADSINFCLPDRLTDQITSPPPPIEEEETNLNSSQTIVADFRVGHHIWGHWECMRTSDTKPTPSLGIYYTLALLW